MHPEPHNTASFDEPWWKQRLRDHGLRATTPRLGVLRILSASPVPLTALEILDIAAREVDDTSDRVTVYRTLASLVESGLAHRMDPGDRVWRFGLLGSPNHQHEHKGHAHFVCDECGEVRCLSDAMISVSLKGRAAEQKLRIKQQDVYLHGTCESCQEDEGGEEAESPRDKPRG